MNTRIPLSHSIQQPQPKRVIYRRIFRQFNLPPIKGMREPGTTYVNVLTSEGHTLVDLGQ